MPDAGKSASRAGASASPSAGARPPKSRSVAGSRAGDGSAEKGGDRVRDGAGIPGFGVVEDEGASVVGVAVGGVCLSSLHQRVDRHPGTCERRRDGGRQRDRASLRERGDEQEEVEDEQVVRKRLLRARAVLQDLAFRLAAQAGDPLSAEPVGVVQLRRQESHGGETGQLSDEVVVRGAPRREVVSDEARVLPEGPENRRRSVRVQHTRASEAIERQRERDRAKARLEAVAPRDSTSRCGALDPGEQSSQRRVGEPLVAAQPPAESEERQLLTAVQLPDPLGVAVLRPPVVQQLAVSVRPRLAGERIVRPVGGVQSVTSG